MFVSRFVRRWGLGLTSPLGQSEVRVEKKYLPVFTGGFLGNNEIIIPYENFMFESETKLWNAFNKRPFNHFFPFPVIFSRVVEVEKGSLLKGVEVEIAGQKFLAISGDWYDTVD